MEKCLTDVQEWFSAITKGKLSSIQKLLKNLEGIDVAENYSINDVEHNNVTGLILAAHIGNKDVVRWFLTNKADPNASTNLGWRAIHFAARRGHVATVDMLVTSGADLEVRTQKNETPLLLALFAHMWDTVRKLMQLGASFDERSEALFIQYAQKGYLSTELIGKRKNFPPENISPKFDHKPFNETS
uniref:ANK_REP_REGION domain-containing protein n=1 Tax=Mesocestoides corti TaxID=53468 RepID=A0A5K3FL63_MESCO